MSAQIQARKYFVSGRVQGVGYRSFAEREATQIKVGGWVRNLRDGRVEVFAMGTPQQLREMRSALERGPTFSSVKAVAEEPAALDPRYEKDFVIGESD